MGALKILLLILCLGLMACGSSTPSASPSGQAAIATASPALTLTPTEMPTPLASTPAPTRSAKLTAQLTVGSIARVVTDDLRVRSRPEVSNSSEKLTPLLQRGQEVFVVKGPVEGSGYRWYEVQPIGDGIDNRPPFGWVAAADKAGEPWLTGGAYDCPDNPTTFAAFFDLKPLGWVACFGRRSMTFPARLGGPEATCGVDPGWTITPEWLASTCPHPRFIVFAPEGYDSFESVIDPGLDTRAFRTSPEEKDWIAVRVTGHFDHKAAQKCKGISTDGEKVPFSRDEIVTDCRATFVITGIERRS